MVEVVEKDALVGEEDAEVEVGQAAEGAQGGAEGRLCARGRELCVRDGRRARGARTARRAASQ